MDESTKSDDLTAGKALTSGAQVHMILPNAEAEPVEMPVEHKVMVIEQHRLVGHCPKCGEEIATDNPHAIQAFEQGTIVKAQCKCGQRLLVPGRSKLLKPKDMGRIVSPGNANNRHARRMALAVAKK